MSHHQSHEPSTVEPNDRIRFRTLYEDEHMLVVEKPGGVVTQPGVGHQHDTLLNGLYAVHGKRLRQMGKQRDHGLVHRLDRETSGVIAVALSADAYDGMREAFQQRAVRKFYWAVCSKAPRDPDGVIRKPIEEVLKRKDRYTSTRTAKPVSTGKPAMTAYRVLQVSDMAAMIEARPITGRLHQIRVHLSLIGSPVLGDTVYGSKRTAQASARLALHAHRLAFTHPMTGAEIDIRAAFPKDLRSLLTRMELARPDTTPPEPAAKVPEST